MRLVVFGANGGVGREIVGQALAQGHDVTSAVRAASAWDGTLGGQVAVCDVTDAGAVERTVKGHDAVICTLGVKGKGPISLYSTGARNIIAGMEAHRVRRLLFLSNFGILNERGQGFGQSMLLLMIKRALRHTLADHRAALNVLQRSGVGWTAVRALALSNGPRTGRYRLTKDDLPANGTRIARADVAHFMLDEAQRGAFMNCAPAIAY